MSLEEDISRILGRGKTSADPEVLALHAGDNGTRPCCRNWSFSRKARKTSPC